MADFSSYVSVVVDLAINKVLDYGIPKHLDKDIIKGSIVEVLVQGRPRQGYVIEKKDKANYTKVLPIKSIISSEALITEDLMQLATWMTKYYQTPLYKILKTILPPSIRKATKPKQQLFVRRNKTRQELEELCRELRNKSPSQAKVLDTMLLVKKGIFLSELIEKTGVSNSPIQTLAKKGFISLDNVHIDRHPITSAEYFQTKPKILNESQTEALKNIYQDIDKQHYATHLLYGITGSGKTEIYLQAIDYVTSKGMSAIMLIPEISLTAQTIERFKSRFNDDIAILHHRLSAGERFDQWHKIHQGKCKIIIGARSAVFCPAHNLGLIIVDEEHELSYKQTDSMPCYNARDIAVMRGMLSKSTVILGSATPSIESYYNTTTGKYKLSTLKQRIDTAKLPEISLVDMRKEYTKQQGYTAFSEELIEGIKQRHAIGEQTILFLNRRGYHTTLLCRSCGNVISCPNCDISLSYHYKNNALSCHLCDYTLSPPPRHCPQCSNDDTMQYKGVGTELIERSLHALLPDVRTIRLDADTTKHKGSHEKLLRDFRTGKGDVLIGTQMIAKGLHFPEVTLVGILNGDISLNIPDFRAAEHTFQIITQVSGRAGRGFSPGKVIVQTCMPDNTTLKLAIAQDFEAFYQQEVSCRQFFHYPPYNRIVKLVFSGKNNKETEHAAQSFYQQLKNITHSPIELNPVISCGHAKVKNLYRFQFLIRGPNIYDINQKISIVRQKMPWLRKISLFIDVDPQSTFF